MSFNREKMRELICYILDKFENDSKLHDDLKFKNNLNRELLCKILYFSDFNYYNIYNKSITGEMYKKYPTGPLPLHFAKVKDELLDEKIIKESYSLIYLSSTLEIFYSLESDDYKDDLKLNSDNVDLGINFGINDLEKMDKKNKNILRDKELKIVDFVMKNLLKIKEEELKNYPSEKDRFWCATKEYCLLKMK